MQRVRHEYRTFLLFRRAAGRRRAPPARPSAAADLRALQGARAAVRGRRDLGVLLGADRRRVRHAAQRVEPAAADVDHRHARVRDGVRHHRRRDRPVGRLAARAARRRRGDPRRQPPLAGGRDGAGGARARRAGRAVQRLVVDLPARAVVHRRARRDARIPRDPARRDRRLDDRAGVRRLRVPRPGLSAARGGRRPRGAVVRARRAAGRAAARHAAPLPARGRAAVAGRREGRRRRRRAVRVRRDARSLRRHSGAGAAAARAARRVLVDRDADGVRPAHLCGRLEPGGHAPVRRRHRSREARDLRADGVDVRVCRHRQHRAARGRLAVGRHDGRARRDRRVLHRRHVDARRVGHRVRRADRRARDGEPRQRDVDARRRRVLADDREGRGAGAGRVDRRGVALEPALTARARRRGPDAPARPGPRLGGRQALRYPVAIAFSPEPRRTP
ncbi:hypothetical protein BVI2075_360057 [Burkholderia vietnamiensis]|nr:hypothetical protein BVI2075_360057 [Burkholderia vietnamiensis]